MKNFLFICEKEFEGVRIDKFIHDCIINNTEYKTLSRKKTQEFIKSSLLKKNGDIFTDLAYRTKCGDIIESKYTHDFKECSCKSCFVDGGHEYLRRGFIEKGCFEELSEVIIEKSELAPITSPMAYLRSLLLFPPHPNREMMRLGE